MINKKYKWIYVHPSSCSGSPVEYLLGKISGGFQKGYPLNYSFIPDTFDGTVAVDHYSIVDWETELGEEFDSYWKFSFARNPFDRCLSVYSGIVRDTEHGYSKYLKGYTFEESILNGKLFDWFTPLFSNGGFYRKLNNTLGVDFIGKVETFQEDFDFICNYLGLKTQKLPHMNKSDYEVDSNVSYYSASKKYFTSKSIEIISEVFCDDIEWYKDQGVTFDI